MPILRDAGLAAWLACAAAAALPAQAAQEPARASARVGQADAGPRAAARAAADVVLRDAWVRESAAAGGTSAAYVTIENRTARDMTLIGVTVARARRAELHAMGAAHGRAGMRAQARVPIPARSSVAIAPGGTHIMLFGVDPPFAPGERVTMTLTFDGQRQRTVRAVVRPLDATSAR